MTKLVSILFILGCMSLTEVKAKVYPLPDGQIMAHVLHNELVTNPNIGPGHRTIERLCLVDNVCVADRYYQGTDLVVYADKEDNVYIKNFENDIRIKIGKLDTVVKTNNLYSSRLITLEATTIKTFLRSSAPRPSISSGYGGPDFDTYRNLEIKLAFCQTGKTYVIKANRWMSIGDDLSTVSGAPLGLSSFKVKNACEI